MTFQDIFKSGFLENVGSVSMLDMTLALVLSFGLGTFIFFVYKKTFSGVMYSSGFGVTLIALTMITTVVILAVTSNVVLSLGMVGALSIVRFRTAVKDPLDLVFMFWSLAVGIICGTGLFDIAAILSIAVTAVIFALDKVPVMQAPMILMVQAMYCDMENDLQDIVSQYTKYYKVKSRNITPERTSIVIELRVKDGGALVQSIGALEGILYVSMIDHDGEVTF